MNRELHKSRLKRSMLLSACLSVFFVFVLFFVAVPDAVFAQNAPDQFGVQAVDETIELGGGDLRLVVARIIRAVLGLLGLIAVVVIMYGGYLIMTSGGSEEKVANGRKTLINGVIGLAIILLSLSIVQFLINGFSGGTGLFGGSPQGPSQQTFTGSAALGDVVKDHYPFRDQVGVARNTQIVVTFFDPMEPSSFIDNTNGSVDEQNNPIYGDCVTPEGATPSWDDCDRIKTSVVQIFASPENEGDPTTNLQAAVKANYLGGQANTFNFKPFTTVGDENSYELGSDTENIWYTVRLTNEINVLGQQTGAFSNQLGAQEYYWEFEVGTEFDFDPPYVVWTSPADDQISYRNDIIQITFNEPVDPSVVQGTIFFEEDTSELASSSFQNLVFLNDQVVGEWRITNGYKTVEFIPSSLCGVQNSCGEEMYCLPIPESCAGVNDITCTENYGVLVRTADLLDPNGDSFVAVPFSGVADLASNALDNRPDKTGVNKPGDGIIEYAGYNHRPTKQGLFTTYHPIEEAPNNYWMNFVLLNDIDLGVPHIETVTPLVDQAKVSGEAALALLFSREMWIDSIYEINVEEYPLPDQGVEKIWTKPTSDLTEAGKTQTIIEHRVFGPNEEEYYYFPQVPSDIRSKNQQCLYPGRGPAGNGACLYDIESDPPIDSGCVSVDFNEATDTGCPLLDDIGSNAKADIAACLDYIKDFSPLPSQ